MKKVLALENIPLFTQNAEFLKTETTRWLTIYGSTRDAVYLQPNRSVASAEVDDTILVMAKVRAYFQIAYNVSSENLIIDGSLIRLTANRRLYTIGN